MGVTLAKEPDSFRSEIGTDGLLQEPFQAVPHHHAHAVRRGRSKPQAFHRIGERLADRRVAIDQRAVQVEDNE